MSNNIRQPLPRAENPIELELLAIHALAPETLHIQLLTIGALAVASAIESAFEK